MSDPIPYSLNINTRPRCPECGSIAIASRLIFTDQPNGEGYFTYMGKVCKSCDHQWRPEETQ